MVRFILVVIFCVLLHEQEISSNILPSPNGTSNRVQNPRWNQLSVTWMKLFRLPLTTTEATRRGWVRDRRYSNRNYFCGNRYLLGKDKSVMLLFDDRKIVGIQGGINKKKVSHKSLPWIRERGHYVMTAYFRDPVSVCSNNNSGTEILGDRLLIQNGSSALDYVTVPLREQRLMGTKWVRGKCYWSMGQLYWYNISSRMPCQDLFPVFLMYNNGELNGFGWIVLDKLDITTSTFVRATNTSFKYFFQSGSMPECLKTAGHMSLQHIFLDDTPFLNLC